VPRGVSFGPAVRVRLVLAHAALLRRKLTALGPTTRHALGVMQIEPVIAPPNALGLRSVMSTVVCVDDTVAGARLRANGAELVGEVGPVRGQLKTLLRARPCGHHRRAGRGTFQKRALTGGALGAPSTRSHGSLPSTFSPTCAAVLLDALNHVRASQIHISRRTATMSTLTGAPEGSSRAFWGLNLFGFLPFSDRGRLLRILL
jgi:hypothetical protein